MQVEKSHLGLGTVHMLVFLELLQDPRRLAPERTYSDAIADTLVRLAGLEQLEAAAPE